MPDLPPTRAKLVQTQEEERYRLAHYLQDGPAQLFANAALEIETSLRLLEKEPEAARAGLIALISELRRGLSELRDWIAELQPPLLAELGLGPSLERYATSYSKRTGIATALSGWQFLSNRLPATMEIAIFRIIQEALENIRTHAQATQAEIRLDCEPQRIVVTVEDNGKGFAVENGGIAERRRLGLVAMSDRAELLGGQLQIFSEPARGVRVVLTVPFNGREQ